MKYLLALTLLIGLVSTPLAFSTTLLKAHGNSGLYCHSIDDYNDAKSGVYRISVAGVSLQKDKHFIIKAHVDAEQCQKNNNKYQWKSINPLHTLRYEHAYYDEKTKTYRSQLITLEHKNVWLSVMDDNFNELGLGDVKRKKEQAGYPVTIVIPVAKVMSDTQFQQVKSGKSRSIRLGIFLKTLTRQMTKQGASQYEKISDDGLYYVVFTMRGENGKLRLF